MGKMIPERHNEKHRTYACSLKTTSPTLWIHSYSKVGKSFSPLPVQQFRFWIQHRDKNVVLFSKQRDIDVVRGWIDPRSHTLCSVWSMHFDIPSSKLLLRSIRFHNSMRISSSEQISLKCLSRIRNRPTSRLRPFTYSAAVKESYVSYFSSSCECF